MTEPASHGAELVELKSTKMPFGKYKGTLLYQLPVSYLEWFGRKGFPPGKIGRQLQLMLELKMNGIDYLLEKL